MYINLLYLPLFNFAYLFFLFFLFFPLSVFVSFIFIALFPNWHFALGLFPSLYFSQFCSGRYNFLFSLFTGSIFVLYFCWNVLILLMDIYATAKSRQSCPTLCDPLDGTQQTPLSLGFSRQEHQSGCHFLLQCMKVKSESEVAQSYPTLSNPMDCSLPGSSIHGILQARVLEWGAIAFSDGCICICVYSAIIFIVINLCLYVGLLQF